MDLDNIQRKYGLPAPLPVVKNGKFATRFPLNLEHRGDDVFQFGGKYIGEIENIYDLLYKILTNQEIDASLALPYAIKITEDKLYVRDKTNSEWILIFDITKPNFPKEIELYELIYKAITHQVIGEDTSYPGQFKIEENILYVRDKDNLTWTQIGDVTKEFLGATEATQAILEQVNEILIEVQELKTELNRQIATANETLTTALQAANEAMTSAQSINIRTFNSVEEMKASNTLKAGALAKTLGFYTAGDGGGSDYIIINNIEAETEAIQLQNGLYALMLKPNLTINFKQVGGKSGERENNNSEILQNLINNLYKKRATIIFDDTFYFYTPIYSESIVGITFEGTSVYTDTPTIKYMGEGYFLSCNVMHSTVFKNLALHGNDENYGISTGEETTFSSWLTGVTFYHFRGHLAINSSAYFYLNSLTFMGAKNVEFFVRVGNPNKLTNMEGLYMKDCKLDANSTEFYNCDLLQIYNIRSLYCNNCDFANTSGHWLYINNTVGTIYNLVFFQCAFTRSKKGIGIRPTKKNNIYRINIHDCNLSLNGTWEDGEQKLIYVDDAGDDIEGEVRNLYINNIYIQRIDTQYTPDYFFYGGEKGKVWDADISFKRPSNVPINKFMVTGIGFDESKIPTTYDTETLTADIEMIKSFNNMAMRGTINTKKELQAYSIVFNINQSLFFNTKTINFIAYTANGDIYPLYLEGTTCKTRKTIPADVYLYFYSMAYAV